MSIHLVGSLAPVIILLLVGAVTNTVSIHAQTPMVYPDGALTTCCLQDGTLFRYSRYTNGRNGDKTRFYLFRSMDGGNHWEDLFIDDKVDSVYQVIAVGNSLFARTRGNGIVRSDDRGNRWSRFFDHSVTLVGRNGRLLAYGWDTAWVYDLAQERWVMGPIPFDPGWKDPDLLNDGRLVIYNADDDGKEPLGLYEWDPAAKIFRLITIPDLGEGLTVSNSYASNGEIYYVTRERGNYGMINGGPEQLSDDRFHYAGYISLVNDDVVLMSFAYYLRSDPSTRHPYGEVLQNKSTPGLMSILQCGSNVIIQLHTGFYRVDSWSPFTVTEVWYDQSGDMTPTKPIVDITSNGTWVMSQRPYSAGSDIGYSVDGGLSWHTRKGSVSCDNEGALVAGPNGVVLSLQLDNCFRVSYNNGITFEDLAWETEGMYPHNFQWHDDGSLTFFTVQYSHIKRGGRCWYAPSIGDPLQPRTSLDGYRIVLSNNIAYKLFEVSREYVDVIKTDDNGLTSRPIFRDSMTKSFDDLHLFRLSDSEIAIVDNWRDSTLVQRTSQLYLVDAVTDKITSVAFVDGTIIDVKRRPNGQLIALMGDMSFLIFDENDRNPVLHRDMVIGPMYDTWDAKLIATDDLLVGYNTALNMFCRYAVDRNITDVAEVPHSSSSTSLTFYPNPTTGNIRCSQDYVGDPYRIFDVTGRVVSTGHVDAGGWLTVNTQDHTTGLLFVAIQTKGGIHTGTVVVH